MGFCKKCGTEYQDSNRFCGKCGVDLTSNSELVKVPIDNLKVSNHSGKEYQPKRKKKIRPWVIIGGVLFLIWFIHGLSIGFGFSPDYIASEATKNNVTASDAIKVTSADLYKEYEANVLRVDNMYKDKLVEVTGFVTDISNSWNKPSITLNCNGGLFNNVDCSFKGQTQIDNIAKLNKGDLVTLRGIVHGKILGSVEIERCEVITYKNE